MTGPEHYREAEVALNDAEALFIEDGSEGRMDYHLRRAQVHAQLALVAATAYPAVRDYVGDEGHDSREWAKVL